MNTEGEARAHWVHSGLPGGLAAHRNWAPVGYLATHSDVANLYGSTNYAGAVSHYIDHGSYEGRAGRYRYSASMTRVNALLHPLVFNPTGPRSARPRKTVSEVETPTMVRTPGAMVTCWEGTARAPACARQSPHGGHSE